MKKGLRLLALILVGLMLLPTVIACKKKDETQNDRQSVEVSVDTGTGFSLEQTDWGANFNIIAPNWASYVNYFFYDSEIAAGDPINDALFTREQQVKDYLGVNITYSLEGEFADAANKFKQAYQKLTNSVSVGDDSYQLFLTHTYINVAAMSTEGMAYDFNLLNGVNLDAKYWNRDIMEELSIGGSLYYGHSDYTLADPNAVFFNKTMQANYGVEDPYKMVREGTWTLEKMYLESTKVGTTAEEDKRNTNTKLGFASIGDWYFIPFLDSCETGVVINENGYKTIDMSPSNDRYSTVYDQIDTLTKADTSLIYQDGSSDVPTPENSITSGRVLFSLVAVHTAEQYRATDVKFGILPYPKYDEEQEEYHSFDWSGFMCVPVSVENPDMVAQTLECLSYFSADTIHIAYYETLLGAKIADAPDDYEMLQIIYDGICANVLVNMMDSGGTNNTSLHTLAYAYKSIAASHNDPASKTKPGRPESIVVQWQKHGGLAQKALDTTINS